MSFKEKFNEYVKMVNDGLENILPSTHTLSERLCESMRYSIMSGGKINWQELLQMAIGFGLFFFPKTLALFVLPSTVSGISGGQFNPSTVYTPDEILTCICKAIM